MLDINFDFDELFKYEQDQFLNKKEESYKEIKPRKLTKEESQDIIEKNFKLIKEVLGDNDD